MVTPRKDPTAPAKRGRRPAGKPRHPSVNTTLPPEVAAWLAEVGNGSASRGLRAVAVEAFTSRKKGPASATIPDSTHPG